MRSSGPYSKISRFYWLALRLFLKKKKIKKYWRKAHLSLSNSFDLVTFSYLLNALKLPLGKVEPYFNVATLLRRVDRGVPVIFWNIDTYRSGVDIRIC